MDKQLCIVLRTIDYKDNDKILTLFSRELGRLSILAKGVKKLKSKLSSATQLFCCAEFEWYERNGKMYLSGADIRQEFFGIQNDYDKFVVACTLIELTDKILQHEDEYEKLFMLLSHSLYAIEKGLNGELTVLSYFFVQALNIMGVFPQTEYCVLCGEKTQTVDNWSHKSGGCVCNNCANATKAKKVSAKIVTEILNLASKKPKEIENIEINGKELTDIVSFIYTYLSAQTDIKLRSVRCFT